MGWEFLDLGNRLLKEFSHDFVVAKTTIAYRLSILADAQRHGFLFSLDEWPESHGVRCIRFIGGSGLAIVLTHCLLPLAYKFFSLMIK